MQEKKHINVIFQLELKTCSGSCDCSCIYCRLYPPVPVPVPVAAPQIQSALSYVRFVLCLCCCFSLFPFAFLRPFFTPVAFWFRHVFIFTSQLSDFLWLNSRRTHWTTELGKWKWQWKWKWKLYKCFITLISLWSRTEPNLLTGQSEHWKTILSFV